MKIAAALKERSTIAVLVVTTALLAACDKPSPEAPARINVQAAPLATLLVDYDYRASAQALSLRSSDIAAEIAANVAAIAHDAGEEVAQGDTLIALDCRETQAFAQQQAAAVAASRARESLAGEQLRRAQGLRASRSISEEELNQKQSALDAASAEARAQTAALEIARLNVERCQIRAPFAGVITARMVQQGERVSAGTVVLHLVDNRHLQVEAQVAANAADSLRDAPLIEFVDVPHHYAVQLTALADVIDQRNYTQAARLAFIDAAPKAGTLGQLLWHDRRRALPPTLVSQREEQPGLLYLDGNRVMFHPLPDVTAGRPIFPDLAAETQIITDGRHAVQAGDIVSIAGAQ